MISVIIPHLNDPNIFLCLKALQAGNYPDEKREIVLVDNGSDGQYLTKLSKYDIRLIAEPKPGSYAARNTGAASARGDILAFIDSDCLVKRDWLEKIAETLKSDEIDGALGFSEGINKNLIAELEQKLYEKHLNNFVRSKERLDRIDTRNFAIKKTAFNKAGGFRAEFPYGADYEFGARGHHLGLNIVYNQNIIVGHVNETKLLKLINKRVKQSATNIDIISKNQADFNKKYFAALSEYWRRNKNQSVFYLLVKISALNMLTALGFPIFYLAYAFRIKGLLYLIYRLIIYFARRKGLLLGIKKIR